MFQLEKWYGDVATSQEAGACAILYSARLHWGPMRLGYAATIHLSADRPAAPREATTWRGGALPLLDGDRITWRNAPLRVTADWRRDAPAIARRLANGPDGEIDWTCHFPRARAGVRIGSDRLEGLGYVERLRLTIPPWKLPFRALRWGRHLSADHYLVWIDWSGGDTRRWVWLDGVEQPAATVGEHGVAGLEGGGELRWSEGGGTRPAQPSAAHQHRRARPGIRQAARGTAGALA